jgi:hypothetical protein
MSSRDTRSRGVLEAEVRSKALQTLVVYKYCKRAAGLYGKCMRENNHLGPSGVESACGQMHRSFEMCKSENATPVT